MTNGVFRVLGCFALLSGVSVAHGSTGTMCPGDFNDNGAVDISDLGVFAESWERTDCVDCVADLNLDGQVDILDLGLFGKDYGRKDCAQNPAPKVLVIHDGVTTSVSDLVFSLRDEGLRVTLSEGDEGEYDGSNPSPDTFDAVIHLTGNTRDDMPIEGQMALVDFVRAGGAYIGSEWTSWEAQASVGHYAEMSDLRLFEYVEGACEQRTLLAAPDAVTHPISEDLDGASIYGCYADVALRSFEGAPARVLMEHADGQPAVATRAVGEGRVVAFDLALNFGNGWHGLGSNLDVQQFYINAVKWAHSLQPGAYATAQIGAAGGVLTLGGLTLTVPAGALSETTEIYVMVTHEPSRAEEHGVDESSPVFFFGPSGLTFSVPAEFEIPFDGSADSGVVYWETEDHTGYEALESTVEDGVLRASVAHFSRAFTASDPSKMDLVHQFYYDHWRFKDTHLSMDVEVPGIGFYKQASFDAYRSMLSTVMVSKETADVMWASGQYGTLPVAATIYCVKTCSFALDHDRVGMFDIVSHGAQELLYTTSRDIHTFTAKKGADWGDIYDRCVSEHPATTSAHYASVCEDAERRYASSHGTRQVEGYCGSDADCDWGDGKQRYCVMNEPFTPYMESIDHETLDGLFTYCSEEPEEVAECTPGQTLCTTERDGILVCNDEGTDWVPLDDCSADEVCDMVDTPHGSEFETEAECVSNVCEWDYTFHFAGASLGFGSMLGELTASRPSREGGSQCKVYGSTSTFTAHFGSGIQHFGHTFNDIKRPCDQPFKKGDKIGASWFGVSGTGGLPIAEGRFDYVAPGCTTENCWTFGSPSGVTAGFVLGAAGHLDAVTKSGDCSP